MSLNNQKYQIKEIQTDKLEQTLPKWKEWNSKFNNGIIFQDPEWIIQDSNGQKENLRLFLLEKYDNSIWFIPFRILKIPLKCQIGEFTLANIPLKRLHPFNGYGTLCNYANLPNDTNVYDLLFSKITDLKKEFDAVYLPGLKTDSFFWEYLHSSPCIKNHFRVYEPKKQSLRPLIKMDGSFDDYLQKFSSQERHNFFRRIRRLKKEGDIEVVRITKQEDVDAFVDEAIKISKKSFQYSLLNKGIRDTDKFKKELKFIANRGWLRSYLLKCGGVGCSFIIGYQDPKNFYHVDIAYDSDWKKFGVGSILNFLAIEDLFKYNTPHIFDFNDYAEYKGFFSNTSYTEAEIYLFPKRAYTLFVQSLYHTFSILDKSIRNILEHLHLKRKIKRMIRSLSMSKSKNETEDAS